MEMENKNDIILHGSDGKLIKARTVNQRKMVKDISKNDMIFSKHCRNWKNIYAVALAVKALKSKQIKELYFNGPAVESGENLGFLPGDLKRS